MARDTSPIAEDRGFVSLSDLLTLVESLPRRPGPTPDTEYIQSPADNLWYQVPKAPPVEALLTEYALSDPARPASTMAELARHAQRTIEQRADGTGTWERKDRKWIDWLPRRPGPTHDTEYVQLPWDGSWVLLDRIPTFEELKAKMLAECTRHPGPTPDLEYIVIDGEQYLVDRVAAPTTSTLDSPPRSS